MQALYKTLYNEYLNETLCEGKNVKLGGLEFEPAQVLREVDPIAYQTGFDDWCDSEGIDTDDLE